MRPVKFTLACTVALPDSFDSASEEEIIQEINDNYPSLFDDYFFMTFVNDDITISPPVKMN